MARPDRNNVDYYPHEVINGKKMHYIETKYKNDGYAVWHKLLEHLGKADYHFLDISDEVQIMYLSSEFNVTEDMLRSILTDLLKLKVFDKELYQSGILYNQKFVDSIKDAYKNRVNSCVTKKALCELLTGNGVVLVHLSGKKPLPGAENEGNNTQTILEDTKVEKSVVEGSTTTSTVLIRKESLISDWQNTKIQYSEAAPEFKAIYDEELFNSWRKFNVWVTENCPYLREWTNQIKIHEYKKIKEGIIEKKHTNKQVQKALQDLNDNKPAVGKYNSVYGGFTRYLSTVVKNDR